MAQVIKYQQGGSTSRKYGTFTIDGNQIEVNDDFLNQITNYGKSLDSDTAYQFSKIADALRQGEDLSYDSNADKLDGNVQFDVTNRQDQRLGKRRSRIGNWFGNSWRGKENASRNAIHALKDFTYIKPTPNGIDYDWSKDINVEYKKDKDGKYELANGRRIFIQGANNLRVRRRLEELKNVANYTTHDTFKGYNKLDKQAYIDLYNRLGDTGIEDLIQRVENGSWTEEDKLALDDIGIFLDPETTNSNHPNSPSSHEDKLKQTLADKGISSPNSHAYVNIDANGNLVVTDLFNQTFGDRNAIYNDWWQQYLTNTGQWNPDFSFLNGYTRVGNRLYKTSDLANENSDLYKFARQQGGFYDLNASNKFNEANSILEYLWGRTDDSSKFDSENLYSSWFNTQSPNLRYRSLTGTRKLPDGQQLIEYWGSDNRDMFGRPETYQYALLDQSGNLIQDNVDINNFDLIEDGQQVGLSALQRINQAGSPYHGRYIMNFSDPSGSINDYTLYIDSNNPDDIILQSKELDNWNASKNKNMRIPKELANQINSNPNFWNNLMQDKTLQNRFIRSLVEGIRTKAGDALTTVNPFSTSTLEISDLEKLGFDRNTAEQIYNYLENVYGDRNGESLWSRRKKYAVDPYQSNIPIHQKGGAISTTKEATGRNDTKKVDSYKDPSKVAGTKDEWNLSHADKLQIASIAGDVAALVAAIPTGGNPVAGALGYGSTLAQFGADVSRDGFQWGDLGSLLVNAGLDTISLLPGVGITGKLAKTGKLVKGSISLIKKALLASGAYNAAKAANNIASGNATLDDWKSLSTGLFAIKGIKNEVQNIRATQYKGKAPKVEGKTKEALKQEYVDKIVADKQLGFVDGAPTRWANADGTVKDYKQAIKDLTESGHLKISKAQEAKWAAEAAKSKSSASVSNLFSGSYNPFSKNYRFRMSNRQLSENFDVRSLSGNTSKLRTLGRIVRQNPEIASQLQQQGWMLPETFTFNSGYGGNWFYRNPIFRRVSKFNWQEPNQLLLPVGSGVRDIPVTLPGRSNPTEILNLDPYTQSVDGIIGLRFHKKGGKIVKAYNGTMIDPVVVTAKPMLITPRRARTKAWEKWKLDQITGIDPDNMFKSNVHLPVMMNQSVVSAPKSTSLTTQFNKDLIDQEYQKITNPHSSVLPLSASISDQNTNEDQGTNNDNSDQHYYGGSGKGGFGNNINPDMLLGVGDFVTSAIGINRTTKKMKDAIRQGMIGSQQQMPTEFYSRFSDNGLYRMYDDRIKNMRQYKTITSDPNHVLTDQLMRDMNIDQMENERNTKFSQLIDQYNDKLLAQKQQYANMRTQIVNENKNRWHQGLAQLDMADANKIGQQTQNVKNLIYQFRQNYAQDLAQRTQMEDKLAEMNAETKYQNQLKALFESKGGFGAMSAEESERFKNDWLGYTAYKWADEVANIRNQAFFDIYQSNANDPKRRHSWINWFRKLNMTPYQNTIMSESQPRSNLRQEFKKGGKTQRFRDVDEQSYLDQQKAINKAVNDLNNNIIKLFIKMMS